MGRGTKISAWIRIGLLLALAMLAVRQGTAAETEKPPSVFEEANRFYEQGNYPEAISRYQMLLKHGVSPQVLFNLGNAHFRNGDVGLAIANYRRAQRLAPRDADVLANLRFARQTVPGTVSVAPSAFARLFRYFTLNEVAAVMALAFWVWLGLLSLIKWQPQWRTGLRTTCLAAGVVFLLTAIWLACAAAMQTRRIAIVTAEQVSARFGPLEESQVAYTANDGAELLARDIKGEWVQVEDRTGRLAWVPHHAVVLFP